MCESPVLCMEDEACPGIQLPLEIWELILENLHSSDLLSAASVCNQWRHLARRLCRARCKRLPPRLLLELQQELQSTACTSHPPSPSPSPSPLASPYPSPRHSLVPYTNEVVQAWSRLGVHETDMGVDGSADDVTSGEGSDWLALMIMLHQTDITTEPECCCITRQLENVTHLASSGNFVVAVSPGPDNMSSTLRVVGCDADQLCCRDISGRVHKVCIVSLPDTPQLLAVCVDKELRCYLPQPHLHTLVELTVLPQTTVDSRLCCDGSILVMSDLSGPQYLGVYEVVPVLEDARVELVLKGLIKTSSSPIYWDLWNGFVTAVVSGGHVVTYTFAGSLVAESPLYKDLRYPNPTVLTRGLVLASTITSRTLLSYWHMDRDRDYWLLGESVRTGWLLRGQDSVGNTTVLRRSSNGNQSQTESPTGDVAGSNGQDVLKESSSVCILSLTKVRVGKARMFETTAMHYKRGLVFCGTSQGHLLIYRLMKHNKNTMMDWMTLETEDPLLNLSVTSRPVSRIVSCFHRQCVVVAVGDRNGNCFIVSIPNLSYSNSLS